MSRPEVPDELVARVRAICLALPEAHEHAAWTGTSWSIRKKTFAQVVHIEDGWPPAFAKAAAAEGPFDVLTFRAPAAELDAYEHMGAPYFRPVWFPDIAGIAIDDATDWGEVAELIAESYCLLAPRRLAASVRDAPPA